MPYLSRQKPAKVTRKTGQQYLFLQSDYTLLKKIVLKKNIRQWLIKKGIYYHLKFSPIFKLYQRILKPAVIQQHKKEVALYRSFLDTPHLIFDIGAYDGHKTAAFTEICSRVVSCEPDPENFKLLKTRFRHQKNVVLHNTALSNHTGTATFFVHHNASAFNTLNADWKDILESDQLKRWNEKIYFPPGAKIEVMCSTLDALIQQHGLPDFIKIDVEGYEKEVFEGLSQKVPCVSFECLLPEFLPQLDFIMQKLITFNALTVFNVIHEEVLLFPQFISYEQLNAWLENCKIHSFDLVAKA